MGRRSLIEFLTGDRPPEQAMVRFDPALDRAVSLAGGAELLAVTTQQRSALGEASSGTEYRVELTAAGEAAVEIIDSDESLFGAEKALIRSLPRKLTQADVRDLFTWGLRP